MKLAFCLSGFANELKTSNKLLPCPLGTYVNFSVNDAIDDYKHVQCSECPAGRVLLFIVNCNLLTEGKLTVGVLYVFMRFRSNKRTSQYRQCLCEEKRLYMPKQRL